MSGERVKVTVDILHIHIEMNGRLRAVEQHGNAAGMGAGDHLFHRNNSAQHVGHVGQCNHSGARGQKLLELIKEKIAVIVDGSPFDYGALTFAQKMPGHDV